MPMRKLLIPVRVIGAAALVLLVYAWFYPERLSNWIAPQASAPALDAALAPSELQVDLMPPLATSVAPVKPVVRLSKAQSAMANWLGSKYRVAPAAIGILIAEADKLSSTYHLSANLLIAVMAIESNFHPYIQSAAGAQGLMQVMPVIHAKRYEKFGGKASFIDPIVSLKVGAEILRDCVKLKGGSETEALRFYFGGGPSSNGYIEKVRSEQARLNRVASGLPVPLS